MVRISGSFMKVKGRVSDPALAFVFGKCGIQCLRVNVCSFDQGIYFRFRQPFPRSGSRYFCTGFASGRSRAWTNGAAGFAQMTAFTPSPLSASSISTQFGSRGLGENGESFTRRSPGRSGRSSKDRLVTTLPQNLICRSRSTKMSHTHARQPQFR
jgi:hypothetical protein